MDTVTGGASYASLNQGAVAKKDDRPLARISDNADRIERLSFVVEQFEDRFYSGDRPETGEPACHPVPVGYNGQLERLTDATDRLDKAVQRLLDIG